MTTLSTTGNTVYLINVSDLSNPLEATIIVEDDKKMAVDLNGETKTYELEYIYRTKYAALEASMDYIDGEKDKLTKAKNDISRITYTMIEDCWVCSNKNCVYDMFGDYVYEMYKIRGIVSKAHFKKCDKCNYYFADNEIEEEAKRLFAIELEKTSPHIDEIDKLFTTVKCKDYVEFCLQCGTEWTYKRNDYGGKNGLCTRCGTNTIVWEGTYKEYYELVTSLQFGGRRFTFTEFKRYLVLTCEWDDLTIQIASHKLEQKYSELKIKYTNAYHHRLNWRNDVR